jgi:hypothetical protein
MDRRRAFLREVGGVIGCGIRHRPIAQPSTTSVDERVIP